MSRERGQKIDSQDPVAQSIIEAINGLEYGEVHISIHDSRVVRIEKIERIRLGESSRRSTLTSSERGGDP